MRKTATKKTRARKPRPGIRLIEVTVVDGTAAGGMSTVLHRARLAVTVPDVDALPPIAMVAIGDGFVPAWPPRSRRATTRRVRGDGR